MKTQIYAVCARCQTRVQWLPHGKWSELLFDACRKCGAHRMNFVMLRLRLEWAGTWYKPWTWNRARFVNEGIVELQGGN